MASKGPKSDSVVAPFKAPRVKRAVPVADAASGMAIPPMLAAEQPTPIAPLVPVAETPAPVVASLVAEAPAAIEPVPETPAPVEPAAPIAVAAPEPVITPELPQPAAAPAPAPLEKDVPMDTITNTAEAAQNQAHAVFNDANDRAKSAMEKGSKMLVDLNDFSKGNIEALVESSKIAAKGAEDVARYTTDYAKATVEKANAAARQFASVKSPTELMRLQSEFAKDAMDSMMAETAKFTENYLKLLGEIAQPISNRVALAAEKMKIAA